MQKLKLFLKPSLIQLQFEVTTSSIPYQFLVMVAEIGGYVGLILGVSVQQVVSWGEVLVNTAFRVID